MAGPYPARKAEAQLQGSVTGPQSLTAGRAQVARSFRPVQGGEQSSRQPKANNAQRRILGNHLLLHTKPNVCHSPQTASRSGRSPGWTLALSQAHCIALTGPCPSLDLSFPTSAMSGASLRVSPGPLRILAHL